MSPDDIARESDLICVHASRGGPCLTNQTVPLNKRCGPCLAAFRALTGQGAGVVRCTEAIDGYSCDPAIRLCGAS